MLVNLSRGTIVCQHVVIADSARRRMRGLLGRNSMPSGEGILLQPAPSIHTAFMRFRIDAVFLDSTLKVKKVVEDLPPWRMASAHNASTVLEMAAGEVHRREISVGDQLGLVEVNDRVGAVVTALQKSRAPKDGVAADELDQDDEPVRRRDHISFAGADNGHGPRVLIVGTDRRFRSVASALLARRGCTVLLGDRLSDSHTLAERTGAHVVVIDAGSSPATAAKSAERIDALMPPVGVVIVGDETRVDTAAPMLEKWGSFDCLYEAIEVAGRDRAEEATNGYRR